MLFGRTLPRFLVIWAAVAVIGCGGGGGKEAPPPGPTNLAAAVVSETEIKLTWNPPPSTVEGYLVERRIANGNFEKLHSGFYPADLNYAYYDLEDQVPDLASLTFRIGASVGGKTSAYSNEVNWAAPVRGPTSFYANRDGGGIRVQWTLATASVGAALHLQERVTSSDGTLGGWQDIPVTAGSTSFLKSDAQQGAEYEYRMTLARGAAVSRTSNSFRIAIPLPPPTGVTATSGIETVVLNWTNQATAASRVVVTLRTSTGTQQVAELPPSASSYRHSPAAPGNLTYVISAGTYDSLYASSDTPANSFPLPAPFSPSSAALADTLSLTWQLPANLPSWASVVVERADANGIFLEQAHFGPTITQYTERGAPLGLVLYRIGIQGGFAPTYSPVIRALVAPSEAALLPLRTSRKYLDEWINQAWPGPDGAWWFATLRENWLPHILYVPRGTDYTDHEVTRDNQVWFANPLRIDASGNPTIGYVEPHFTGSVQTSATFIAAHWNGSNWDRIPITSSENMVVDARYRPPIWFSGPPTAPMAIWNGSNGTYQSRFVQEAWTPAEILSLNAPGSLQDVQTDPSGHPYLIFYDYQYYPATQTSALICTIFHNNPSGGWDRLPDPNSMSTNNTLIGAGFAAFEGGLSVLWRKTDGVVDDVTYQFSRYDGHSWSAPEAFLTMPFDHYAGLLGQVAAQRDGTRFAFVFNREREQWLAIRGADGSWKLSALYPGWTQYDWLGASFSPGGKLRLVLHGSDSPPPYLLREYYFYEEP